MQGSEGPARFYQGLTGFDLVIGTFRGVGGRGRGVGDYTPCDLGCGSLADTLVLHFGLGELGFGVRVWPFLEQAALGH